MTGVDETSEVREPVTSARSSASEEAGRQGLLFGDDVLSMPADVGFRTAAGSGSQRLYSFRDILVLKVIKRLLDTGVSLQNIRTAVEHLRDSGVEDLAQVTLMSDGASVYECRSKDEVIDLVQGGQGVFGIAVGRVWREVEGSLAELPSERVDGTPSTEPVLPGDELAARRAARATG